VASMTSAEREASGCGKSMEERPYEDCEYRWKWSKERSEAVMGDPCNAQRRIWSYASCDTAYQQARRTSVPCLVGFRMITVDSSVNNLDDFAASRSARRHLKSKVVGQKRLR
jgi:hypothetical protein